MRWITGLGRGRGLPTDSRSRSVCVLLKVSGELESSSQNPDEIQGCLQYVFPQHTLEMRIDTDFFFFSIHNDFWVVTVSFSLFLVTS